MLRKRLYIEKESYLQHEVGCVWNQNVLIQTCTDNLLNSYTPLFHESEISEGASGT